MLFSTAFLFAQTTTVTPTPAPVRISERIENIGGTYYYLHTVERGQTLFSIARTYQVTMSQIRRTSDKADIQVGEILQIPSSNQTASRPAPARLSEEVKPLETTQPENVEATPQRFNNPPKSVLNVALMLPLYLNEVDQIRIGPRTNRASIRPFSFVSFHHGATLAARAFEDRNIRINVRVFDVAENENTAINLINSGQLNDIDIIVGPLFARSFEVVSEFAKQREIFIVNPLSNRDEILDNNPFVIKINPSEAQQLQTLLNHVAQNSIGHRILVLANDSLPNERERARQARRFFEDKRNQFDTIVFFDLSRERFPRFRSQLSNTRGNAIIYLSANEAFATEVLTRTPRVEVAPTPNVLYSLLKLSRFEVTDPLYLNGLQTHYIDPFFINHNDERVRDFDLLFFETFGTIPDPMAYRGFDVMSFVFHLLKTGNTNYGNFLEIPFRGLHNTIRLHRSRPSQGLENISTNLLKVESSQLRRVNN